MLVTEALNTDTRVLRVTDSLRNAQEQMNTLHVNMLPVIDGLTKELLGQINRHSIEQVTVNLEQAISSVELQKATVIYNNQHLFYAVQLMLQHELPLLPVVDDDWIYQGMIQKHHLLKLLGQMLNLTEYGSVITIELDRHDFALSEIVQLIEIESGSILGITVETPNATKNNYEVSVKLNLQDVSRVAASLRRHGYTILTESKSETNNIDLESQADEFLKYLDI